MKRKREGLSKAFAEARDGISLIKKCHAVLGVILELTSRQRLKDFEICKSLHAFRSFVSTFLAAELPLIHVLQWTTRIHQSSLLAQRRNRRRSRIQVTISNPLDSGSIETTREAHAISGDIRA